MTGGPTVRVALLGVPEVLGDMLAVTPDIVEVASYTDPGSLLAELPAVSPDVVLIGAGAHATTDVVRQALALAPRARVVTLSRGGRDAVMYRLGLVSTTVENVSADDLVRSLLDAIEPAW